MRTQRQRAVYTEEPLHWLRGRGAREKFTLNRYLVAAAAFLMSACATQQGVSDESEVIKLPSTLPHVAVAVCMAKNFDKISSGFSSTIRPGPSRSDPTAEVVGREGGFTIMIADIAPTHTGSEVSLRLSPSLWRERETRIKQLMSGC